ncbi:flavin reductase family protein [Nanoarchaeota archaeon NZ13-N]|nr:MAG: flavin reductase family protein [Nanoarchaeota archaeon NZ13-N]
MLGNNLTLMKFYYLLHPRPVVAVGSGSIKVGEINFATVSWITPVSEEPPIVGFASYKENYTNSLIEKYKQFSINIIEDIELLWKVGITSGKEIDKVKEFGIKVISGKKLDVPIIEDSLGFMECKLTNSLEVGEGIFYIGEVVNWEAKGFGRYGWEDISRVPMHKGGKAFAFAEKIKIIK